MGEFQKVMEATFETLSDKRCNFNTTCKDKTAALWDTYNHDMYQQRAANPKPAVHTSPMLNDGGGRCLNALICNAGEYMAGAKKRRIDGAGPIVASPAPSDVVRWSCCVRDVAEAIFRVDGAQASRERSDKGTRR